MSHGLEEHDPCWAGGPEGPPSTLSGRLAAIYGVLGILSVSACKTALDTVGASTRRGDGNFQAVT